MRGTACSRRAACAGAVALALGGWAAVLGVGAEARRMGGASRGPGLGGPWPCWMRLRLDVAPDALGRLRSEPRAWVPVTVVMDDGRPVAGRLRIKGRRGSLRGLDEGPSFTVVLEQSVPALGGSTRFHLENGAEDPGCVRGAWAAHVFERAGVPCPRQGWAGVWLNGRDLGWHGLREGLDAALASRCWPGEPVVMAEPRDGADAGGALDVKTGGEGEREAMRAWEALGGALAGGDWAGACRWVDADRFRRVAALEVLMGHRDGYVLARNNYRVAWVGGLLEWIPWGMDTLLETPGLTVWPSMAGSMARPLLGTVERRGMWWASLRAWEPVALGEEGFDAWVRGCEEVLRPRVDGAAMRAWRRRVLEVRGALGRRRGAVRAELEAGVPGDVLLGPGVLHPTGWRAQGVPPDGSAQAADRLGTGVWEVVAGGRTSAAWVARVRLGAGRYRFMGRVRLDGYVPLRGARHTGAFLRVANGGARSAGLQEVGDWKELRVDFRVGQAGTDVSLMCEFRAGSGRAWFERASLLLERLE